MKKILLIVLILINTVIASEFLDIPLKEYIKIVSKQQNISIIIDKNIDSNYSIFISSKVEESVYFDILETILRKNNMILEFNKNHYYISKKTYKTSVKNLVFSYKFHYLNEEDINGLMSIHNYKYKYVPSLKSIFIDCTTREYNKLILYLMSMILYLVKKN